jgi:hypothetical protein
MKTQYYYRYWFKEKKKEEKIVGTVVAHCQVHTQSILPARQINLIFFFLLCLF